MKIAIGNDHAGSEYKKAIIYLLQQKDIEVINYGTDSNESVDYPDKVHPVAFDVHHKKADLGIIICGSGNGANMTANKYNNVRSALCWQKDIVYLARQHNDANILSLPARFITLKDSLDFVTIFIETKFEGGRHQQRKDKISKCL